MARWERSIQPNRAYRPEYCALKPLFLGAPDLIYATYQRIQRTFATLYHPRDDICPPLDHAPALD